MIRARRAALSAAAFVTAALVSVVACTPGNAGADERPTTPAATASATASSSPPASPSASPSDSPSALPARTAPASPAPAPTDAPDTAVRHDPPPLPNPARRTTAPVADPGGSGGVILAPSGNHYRRGQFCKKIHLGLTTRDAHGATLHCAMQSGRPHWQ
ncbi:hypothetical protein [Streptomyces catenulae]|uniref:Uncharacterized protein n=1 Tax=Streptomyces catenulae TaxID=66875 RepID=A0ABV2Z329_9ACTN|nr:hypothetical protein [Streptomyces catenulae]